jgi:hypothetical protein
MDAFDRPAVTPVRYGIVQDYGQESLGVGGEVALVRNGEHLIRDY